MGIRYEVLKEQDASEIKDLCNGLMAYQKSKSSIHPEFFDAMCFETRLLPALKSAEVNFIIAAMDENQFVGYAYSNIASKRIYTNDFATLKCESFFDFDSVQGENVGCLSQFYIKDGYRSKGIGSVLFERSMDWLKAQNVNDLFIFVSNGNRQALKFYLDKGFYFSHEIMDGFITVLRNNR
jgi:GNAT superfamily N-acetyltransferase